MNLMKRHLGQREINTNQIKSNQINSNQISFNRIRLNRIRLIEFDLFWFLSDLNVASLDSFIYVLNCGNKLFYLMLK